MARRPAAQPLPRVIDTQQRVRIPNDVMDALGLEVGDHIGFEVAGDEARIFRVKWVREKK